MADNITPNYQLVMPEISGSIDTWGNKLNTNMNKIDSALKGLQDSKLDNDGDEYTGLLDFKVDAGDRPKLTMDGDANTTSALDTVKERQTAIDNAVRSLLPTGSIIMWSGNSGNIPAGWRLCDGSNSTPNLVNRFILGGTSSGGVGGSWEHNHGGSVTATALAIEHLPPHSHGVNDPGHGHGVYDPGHSHYYESPGDGVTGPVVGPANRFGAKGNRTEHVGTGISIYGSGTGIWLSNTGSGWGHAHGIPTSNHTPPYYTLCFIIKVWT